MDSDVLTAGEPFQNEAEVTWMCRIQIGGKPLETSDRVLAMGRMNLPSSEIQ